MRVGRITNTDGLWFVEGRVTSLAERDRVWEAYNQRWHKAYEAKRRVETRHRKELEKVQAALEAIQKTQPYTPWLGHVEEGPDDRFLADALREWKWRENEKRKS